MKIIYVVLAFLLVGINFASAAPIAKGKLVLAKDLSAKVKGIRTLFFTIYDAANPSTMPCAAQKITLQKDANDSFLDFDLTTDSVMLMGCSEIPAVINLKAKLDADGNAGRDATGDITGTPSNVKKGSANLKIVLDKVIP
jgi:hypothetical protein